MTYRSLIIATALLSAIIASLNVVSAFAARGPRLPVESSFHNQAARAAVSDYWLNWPDDTVAADGGDIVPQISFIDSRTPTCYQPDSISDVCYVNWNYLYVQSAPGAYMVAVTATLDSKVVARYGGFFQTTIYVPFDMNGPGFKVSCGTPGISGVNDVGRVYPYVISAQSTDGLRSANYGSVSCPPIGGKLQLPIILKQYSP